MAQDIDRALLEKAADVTAMALKGSMGGQGSQPPEYAAEVFKAVWGALKEAFLDIPERPRAGF